MSESDKQPQSEIGKRLHDARVAKGYTLDDLQQATKIQKRYLIAIEDENFKELPGDFYVRAFVKQYADMVGLDGNALLKEYNDQLPQTKTQEYDQHISQAVETRSSHHQAVERVDRFRQYLPTIIIIVVIVIVLLAIWMTSIVRNHRDASTRVDSSSVSVSGKNKESSSHKQVKKTTTHKAATKAVRLRETARTNNSVTYSAKSLKQAQNLVIRTRNNSYVGVNVDGSSRLARTMTANQRANVRVAKNASQIVITVGNDQNTTIQFGGRNVDFTNGGKNNQVRRIIIHLGRSNGSSSSSATSTTTRTRTNNTRTTNANSTSQSTGSRVTSRSNSTTTTTTNNNNNNTRQTTTTANSSSTTARPTQTTTNNNNQSTTNNR